MIRVVARFRKLTKKVLNMNELNELNELNLPELNTELKFEDPESERPEDPTPEPPDVQKESVATLNPYAAQSNKNCQWIGCSQTGLKRMGTYNFDAEVEQFFWGESDICEAHADFVEMNNNALEHRQEVSEAEIQRRYGWSA